MVGGQSHQSHQTGRTMHGSRLHQKEAKPDTRVGNDESNMFPILLCLAELLYMAANLQ